MNPSPKYASDGKDERAFTLIEMLVSITILVVLILLITHLFNSAVALTTNGDKHMDADSQARFVFDRMAVDFANMAKRTDVDYYFEKNAVTNDDQMAFFSESAGYYPSGTPVQSQGSISLVGYRINNGKLERLSKALVWNGAGDAMKYLPQTIPLSWPNVVRGGTDPDYQVISDQVFRMEISFLVKDVAGTTVNPVPYLWNQPYLTPLTATNLNGLQDVVAVVVTIAVLDSKSQAIITPAQLTAAAGNLPDATYTGTSAGLAPADQWESKVDSGLGSLPSAASKQVRIYQRYFYLNTVQ